MSLDYPGLIYTTAALFVLSALSVKRIIILRSLYLMGSVGFFLYGLQVNIVEIIFWNGINIIINAIRIGLYLIEINPWFIKETDLELYNLFFKKFMLPGHFRTIIKLARTNIYSDTTILEKNVFNKELYFVLHVSGKLLVESECYLAHLHEHSFFGEMSFLKEQKTIASVRIDGEVVCYHWSEKNLKILKNRHPVIFSTLILILSHDLVQKMNRPIDDHSSHYYH